MTSPIGLVSDPLAALLGATAAPLTGLSSPAASSASIANAAPAATADISGPGRIVSLLQQLQEADPAKFKQVTAQIAAQLKAAAQQQGSAGGFLAKLADRFQQASQTGDAGSLAGSERSQRRHHHHGTYDRSGQPVVAPSDTTNLSSLKDLFGTIAGNLASTLGG